MYSGTSRYVSKEMSGCKMGRYRKHLYVIMILVFFPGSCRADSTIEAAGDVLYILMPVSTYGSTFYCKDKEGRKQFYKSFAASWLTTRGLKYMITKPRPDNSDNNSFPSGHASTTFQAAAYIRKRFGWKYGLPAYAGASFVAYSRVYAEKHYVEDVLAGAAIGIVAAEVFTTPRNKLAVAPIMQKDIYGLIIRKRF
jgi:membrane-associated phospholipid phosphatase